MTNLASAIEGLLSSEKYSDLTLICEEVRFKVHRAVVCTRSRVFAAAVDGDFKESIFREIDLSDDEITTIRALINYLYTGGYEHKPKINISKDPPENDVSQSKEADQPVENAPSPSSSFPSNWGRSVPSSPPQPQPTLFDPEILVFHVKMYIAGDKYDIPDLKELAKVRYEGVVPRYWNSKAFSESIRLLWENTVEQDVALKQVISKVVASNIIELLNRGEFVDTLKCHGDIAVEVLRFHLGSFKMVEQGHANKKRKKGKGALYEW